MTDQKTGLSDEVVWKTIASQDDTGFVLDASAILTYLRGQSGGNVVERILRQCHDCQSKATICALDVLSLYSKIVRENPSLLDDLISLVDQLPLAIEPLTHEGAIEAARILISHPELEPNQALSVALCKSLNATLVTCDNDLNIGSKILHIRKNNFS